MKVFLLKQLPEPSLDEAIGFVIIADDWHEARQTAGNNAADEGKEVWLSRKYSTCTIIGEANDSQNPGIVLSSFNNG